MLDAITTLAFSVHSGKGVYALLLGSGLSRAAQIPTGWEVTVDLIRKVAAIGSEDCGPDPEAWYAKKYGAAADYSTLLESLAVTPSERTNILTSYFEASEEERALERKVPTKAHRAIAELAAKGYFRVIVTTNFDRLMEQALEAAAVNPTVISSADMVAGALPLAHAKCTVLKLHGDYRDSRMRNTVEELESYPPEMNKLLDRILDEYGLIVCGWSATWDRALRDAMLRAPNRRFSCFWAIKEKPSPEATDLIRFRQSLTVEIESADDLFGELRAKIEALELFNRPHPLSTAMAVVSLKKYLTEDRYRIELRDLVLGEVDRSIAPLGEFNMNTRSTEPAEVVQDYKDRLTAYEQATTTPVALVANGCFYGTRAQENVWRDAILRATSFLKQNQGGSQRLVDLRLYPALLLMYSGGVSSVASGNYSALRSILRDTKARTPLTSASIAKELLIHASPVSVLDADFLNWGLKQKWKTPISDWLRNILREPLRTLIPADDDFDDYFDRFEYLMCLVYYDIKTALGRDGFPWAPIGRFGWRKRGFGDGSGSVVKIIETEFATEQEDWEPINSGLFAGAERFKEVSDAYQANVLGHFDPY